MQTLRGKKGEVMAGFYSFGRIKIISRNGIKSSVATAAYHAAVKITNEYDGVTHDHTKKKDVGDTFIRMPETAPDRWKDESIPAKERLGMIWNEIEQIHSASDARLARTNYIALPLSLTLEQGLECVDRFIKENCTDQGMGVTYSTHLMPNNPHVDLMYFVSEYDKKGKAKEKSKKEYLCRNKNGEERYFDAESFKKAEGYEKVYKYQKDGERVDMTPSEVAELDGWERINKYPVCRTIKVSGWDDENLALKWRKSWEVILNEKFEELGLKDRVDCRSHAERGLSQLPTVHEGWGPGREERKAYNEQVRNYNKELKGLYQEGQAAIKNIKNQIADLEQNPQTEETLEVHKADFEQNEKVLVAITESGLFANPLTSYFKAKLADLKASMNKWLENIRKSLRNEIEPSEGYIKPKEQVEYVKDALDSIIEDAVRTKKIEQAGLDVSYSLEKDWEK